MKIPKKDAMEHCSKKAAIHKSESEHHQVQLDKCMASAKLHKAAAERHAISDPAQSQFHRDQEALEKSSAASHAKCVADHSDVQAHYENLRSRLAASPDGDVDLDADVLDNHSDASRDLQSVSGSDGFLKRCGVLRD
jgi:hypothetical protein